MEFEATARARLEKMLCTTDIDPTKLPLSLLEEITKKFADDQQIGSGGFTTVYKVMLESLECLGVDRKGVFTGF